MNTNTDNETPVRQTKFAKVYNRFLGKITDDMYVELTPEDTLRDLHELIMQALPEFEFPRIDLYDYVEDVKVIPKEEATGEDFALSAILDNSENVVVDNSCFNNELTPEEINILAILMMIAWVQRQVTSIENTRMKFSGADFKMTSQANHLQKLLSLLGECQRQSRHLQRLYKRRRPEKSAGSNTELYRSNWDIFKTGVYY